MGDAVSDAEVPLPRIVERLLALLLPNAEREAIIGDLAELFGDRVCRSGRVAATLWLARQTIALLLSFAFTRRRRPTVRRGDSTMTMLAMNLRIGVRMLRRSLTFTAICVGTLALGIGATTAIFSLVNPILFQPLPYPDPDRVVLVFENDAGGRTSNTSYLTFRDLAGASRSLEWAAAVGEWQITATGGGEAERLEGERVSWTYFRALGVRPSIGRDFLQEEDAPSANQVVILSHGLWTRRYGGDTSIVGKTIQLEGAPYLVAGVMPAAFENVHAPQAQIWRVLGYSPELPYACRTCRHLKMVARLRQGVTPATAQSELSELSARLVRQYPKDYAAAGTQVVPMQTFVTHDVKPVLDVLLGAVALVLLISVANVTSLMIARGMRREGEFAIRVALGAGRARLASQLLAEGMLLAVSGGVLGVVVAALALPLLVSRLPDTLPRLSAVHLDLTSFVFVAVVTLSLGIVIGLVPAWRSDRAALSDSIRGGARISGGARHIARSSLVVTEIALALMLLAGAGLLSRSLMRLLSVNAGFDPSHLLTMEVQSTGPRYSDNAAVWANHEAVVAAVRAVPGVQAVATSNQLPLGGNFDAFGVVARDVSIDNPELAPAAQRYVVTPEFMRAIGTPIVRGRAFVDADDRDSSAFVTIVSAALAKRLWPNEDPLGRQIRVGGPERPWRTVVGVAADVRHRGLDDAASYQFYVPDRQWFFSDNMVVLVVRTQGDPASLAAAVRAAAHSVDPAQPVTRLLTMDQVISESTIQRRLALLLFAAFAALAAVLSGAGIYGVLATRVAERTREIGVRSALGASPRDILQLVVRQATWLIGVGMVAGMLGALLLARFIGSLLFGIDASDPLTYGAVFAVLIILGVVACAAPALRAVRIDPARALRAD
jgi:putative ABC transport system permease protein